MNRRESPRIWSSYSLALSHLASVAVAKGDFDAAERWAHETMLMVSRSRYPFGGFRSLLALACARALRGAWAEAEDALDVLVEPRPRLRRRRVDRADVRACLPSAPAQRTRVLSVRLWSCSPGS